MELHAPAHRLLVPCIQVSVTVNFLATNSPFPRYFKRKGDRETLAPERGYGKYISNMADDEWLKVHARKDELRRKARSLKTTGRKQELIDHVIKAKEDGTETIEERERRAKKVRETRAAKQLGSPSENLPDPKTLNKSDLSKLPKISSKEIIDYLVYGSCKFFQREDMKFLNPFRSKGFPFDE